MIAFCEFFPGASPEEALRMPYYRFMALLDAKWGVHAAADRATAGQSKVAAAKRARERSRQLQRRLAEVRGQAALARHPADANAGS